MRDSRLTFLFLLFLIPTLGISQSKVILGKITNSKDVEGIHVLNTSSGFNTISDNEGAFRIKVKLLDTLVVSSIHYMPQKLTVTPQIYQDGIISVTLEDMVNELAEVYILPNLSGDLERDIKRIQLKDTISFDDVGIPGFMGVPQEKIAPVIPGYIPTKVDLEALYKHLSGYYKTLRTKRKWESQNNLAVRLINFYTAKFFVEAYQIPENRQYDFMLFCMETSNISSQFNKENYARVLEVFSEKSEVYRNRLPKKEE